MLSQYTPSCQGTPQQHHNVTRTHYPDHRHSILLAALYKKLEQYHKPLRYYLAIHFNRRLFSEKAANVRIDYYNYPFLTLCQFSVRQLDSTYLPISWKHQDRLQSGIWVPITGSENRIQYFHCSMSLVTAALPGNCYIHFQYTFYYL